MAGLTRDAARICEYCDREFTTAAEAVSHKEDAHHYCRECDRLFRNGIQQDHHFANAAIHAYKGKKGEVVKPVDRTGALPLPRKFPLSDNPV
jgi:hypothetical protein